MVERAKLSNGYYLLREYDAFVGISEGYFGVGRNLFRQVGLKSTCRNKFLSALSE